MGEPITLTKGGKAVTVDSDQAGQLAAAGWVPETGQGAADRVTEEGRQDVYGGAAGKTLAFGANALSGATLGISDALLSAGGAGDTLSALRDYNPGTATAGLITGAVLPAFLAPESLLAKTPAGLTARLGARIAEAGEGASLAGRAAYAAGGAATEGALQNAGSYVSDVALGDRDLSAEGFVGAMGKGALYGGVAGGALSVASNGLIAARKLIPLSEQTPEAAVAAETTARRAVKDSVETSKGLEATGGNEVARADRETEQFLQDLEAERAAAMKQAAPVAETAGPAGETQVAQTSSAVPETAVPGAEAPTGEPAAPRVKHPAEGAKTGKDAKQLLKDWRAKYAEGAVDYDAANAAARRGRLAEWARDFEPKTPEDEVIKDYFSNPMEPGRTDMRIGDELGDVPEAVKKIANSNAAHASHEAYLAETARAADISKSGTEAMARSIYAGRRAAARALDDVYTAYRAGQPIVDIRAAATQKLTGQLHELAEARNDLIKSLAGSSEADSLLEKLKGTAQAVNETGKLPSLGERILEGAKPSVAPDPDEAIAKALGKSKDVNEDIAGIAPKITRYEAAKAQLTESLGPKASAQAQEHAAAFRAAQEKAESASARQVAQATENIDKAANGAPLEKMVGGKPVLGGLAKTASNAGAAYEALREMGVPLPDPKGIPVIGPILSAYLKAKILGKMMGKFGGSFLATAEGTIAAKAASTRNRIISSVDALAGAAERVQAKTPAVAAATTALGHKLFESPQNDAKPYSSEPKLEPLEKMYQDRMGELVAAMKPGAIEQAVRNRIHTSDPTIVDAIVAAETRRLQYLYNQAPKPDVPPMPGQPPRPPSKTEISQWGVTLAAAHDPAAVFERVAAGGVARPAEVDYVHACCPQLVAEAQARLIEKLSTSTAAPPYMRRVAISALLDVPMDQTMIPENAAYLQSGYRATPPPPAAPMPHPTLTANISKGQESLTRLDR